eukprot:jgi/Chrzof1/9142/Cz03g37140.t1
MCNRPYGCNLHRVNKVLTVQGALATCVSITVPALNGKRSLESMCCIWYLHPLNDANADMMQQQPMVKHSANFDGAMMMVGSAMVKARVRNIKPPPMKQKKYMSCVLLGNLLGINKPILHVTV